MKVILLKNIESLGEAGEVKEVSSGYGRNFLFPENLAETATADNLKKWAENKERRAKAAEQDLILTEKSAEKLNGAVVEIKGKVNEAGKLYAAITAPMIVKKLKELGLEIKKDQVVLPEPIKELGEHPVIISLAHGLEAEVTVVATE